MDLSQYAELFLAESREHLSACNQLLLDWERSPANLAPVGGLFRAVHTVKGMAATMGYARVTDLAHRAENLLDLVRRGGRPATDDLLQLLFRARDALEHAVELSVVEREDEIDVAEVVADLEGAAAHLGRGGEAGGGAGGGRGGARHGGRRRAAPRPRRPPRRARDEEPPHPRGPRAARRPHGSDRRARHRARPPERARGQRPRPGDRRRRDSGLPAVARAASGNHPGAHDAGVAGVRPIPPFGA